MTKSKRKESKCEWISGAEAFRRFATHAGKTQSSRHIKPLHWYIACRLVLEGGFHPDEITPRPPFAVKQAGGKKGRRLVISYDPSQATGQEQVILGGLKTKNVDVVVTKPTLGPVLAISCKGVTKAFRNLTNRMEDTIGECTNLHITYPALVVGYFAILRANRTVADALEAPNDDNEDEDEDATIESSADDVEVISPSLVSDDATSVVSPKVAESIKANDIAILDDGAIAYGISRFHSALCEMTLRRGLRDEISRYEAMTIVLTEPKGATAGSVYPDFPPQESPLRFERFFSVLYQRYEERFVYGASLLAERGITPRIEWAQDSPVFERETLEAADWPALDYEPRVRSS